MTLIGSEVERFVNVGGRPVKVSEAEWIVATAQTGTVLRITPKTGSYYGRRQPAGVFDMVLKGSYFYDGVIGYGWAPGQDQTEDSRLSCFPELGDRIEVLERPCSACGGTGRTSAKGDTE